MTYKLLISVFFVLLLPKIAIISNGFGKRIDREIKEEFNITSFEHKDVSIPEDLRKKLSSEMSKENFFKLSSDGHFIGYIYLDKAPSKTAEFDYMVIFNKDLIIARTKVLVYREEYGGEIGSKRWLRQFSGKSRSSEIRNIAAISGATISVRSMKSAMEDLLTSIQILKENNIL